MRQEKYINRYNEEYTFTLQEDGNILWEGPFEYCRIGHPNDYTEAYYAYTSDGGELGLEEFKKEVHHFIYDDIYDQTDIYVRPSEICSIYGHLVRTMEDVINMVDPSGGPYLSTGMGLMGRIIVQFIPTGSGYLIVTT